MEKCAWALREEILQQTQQGILVFYPDSLCQSVSIRLGQQGSGERKYPDGLGIVVFPKCDISLMNAEQKAQKNGNQDAVQSFYGIFLPSQVVLPECLWFINKLGLSF